MKCHKIMKNTHRELQVFSEPQSTRPIYSIYGQIKQKQTVISEELEPPNVLNFLFLDK